MSKPGNTVFGIKSRKYGYIPNDQFQILFQKHICKLIQSFFIRFPFIQYTFLYYRNTNYTYYSRIGIHRVDPVNL